MKSWFIWDCDVPEDRSETCKAGENTGTEVMTKATLPPIAIEACNGPMQLWFFCFLLSLKCFASRSSNCNIASQTCVVTFKKSFVQPLIINKL